MTSYAIPQVNIQLVSGGCAKHWIVNMPGKYQCSICLESINDGEAVATCNCDAGTHAFHKHCLQPWLARARSCPVCSKTVGIYQGTQPLEKGDYMAIETRPFSLAGFTCPTIVITYNIQNGIQGEEHPNPNEEYFGTHRRAFLPFNSEGIETLRLLRIAWDNRCIFKVGTSLTSGEENVVCWGIIPHKTNPNTDANRAVNFGFPDNSYFDRVKYACNNLGIF
jgi:deltex-like protein